MDRFKNKSIKNTLSGIFILPWLSELLDLDRLDRGSDGVRALRGLIEGRVRVGSV